MIPKTGPVHGMPPEHDAVFSISDSTMSRAGAALLPHPDAKGHSLMVETFKYFWALAHRDPTSGVQV